MEVLVVNQSEVTRLLPMGECIDVMAEALRALARGEAILPLRANGADICTAPPCTLTCMRTICTSTTTSGRP